VAWVHDDEDDDHTQHDETQQYLLDDVYCAGSCVVELACAILKVKDLADTLFRLAFSVYHRKLNPLKNLSSTFGLQNPL
jgi:hypothetical protein